MTMKTYFTVTTMKKVQKISEMTPKMCSRSTVSGWWPTNTSFIA